MYAQVLKKAMTPAERSAATRKAWLSRTRAIHHGGKGVGWLNEDGTPFAGPVADLLKSMKKPIPPGWTDVRVATDPTDSLLVSGTDAKGRNPKIYSAEHTDAAAVAKFSRVRALDKKVDGLVSKSRSDMNDPALPQRERDTAATVNLVTLTGFRPGSTRDTKADEQAYGASTLEKRHIKVKGNDIEFSFTGKKGVAITKLLQDADMAKYLGNKLKSLHANDKVFETSGASALKYLKAQVGDKFKVKDLRTWNGTAVAKAAISEYNRPTTQDELEGLQKEVSTRVSAHLGNTPKVAFDSYIDPSVWPSVKPMTKLKKA